MNTTNEKHIKDATKKISQLFSKNGLPLTLESFSDLLEGKFFTASIALPSGFPREYRDSNKTLYHPKNFFLSIFIRTNPHGVTGSGDVERTLTVSIELLGEKRKFRGKTFQESTIEKHYEFYRFGDERDHCEITEMMSRRALAFMQRVISQQAEEKQIP